MMSDESADLKTLKQAVTSCRFCCTGELPKGIDRPIGALNAPKFKEPRLPEPNPVVQFSKRAKICIAGQAPGNLAHQSGRPFSDPSGVRLRAWLGVDEDQFYNPDNFAIIPMGFCFPGYVDETKRGDLPPRKECAKLWRERVFAAHPQIELILTIGQYAQDWHLGKLRKKSLTQTVQNWRDYEALSPRVIPLPHPSWRNSGWIKKNPWFEHELLPNLRKNLTQILHD